MDACRLKLALSRPRISVAIGIMVAVYGVGVLLGFVPLSGLLTLLGLLAVASLLPLYFALQWHWPKRPIPRVEGNHLVQRRSDKLILAEIDLNTPFTAECVYHSDERAYFRVRQGPTTLRFAAELKEDDDVIHLLRRVLSLQWPPQARITFWP